MLHYKVIKSHINNSLGEYESFGITISENGVIVKVFEDLTSDFNDISNLVSLCNTEQVELVHIDDVIENFLLLGV